MPQKRKQESPIYYDENKGFVSLKSIPKASVKRLISSMMNGETSSDEEVEETRPQKIRRIRSPTTSKIESGYDDLKAYLNAHADEEEEEEEEIVEDPFEDILGKPLDADLALTSEMKENKPETLIPTEQTKSLPYECISHVMGFHTQEINYDGREGKALCENVLGLYCKGTKFSVARKHGNLPFHFWPRHLSIKFDEGGSIVTWKPFTFFLGNAFSHLDSIILHGDGMSWFGSDVACLLWGCTPLKEIGTYSKRSGKDPHDLENTLKVSKWSRDEERHKTVGGTLPLIFNLGMVSTSELRKSQSKQKVVQYEDPYSCEAKRSELTKIAMVISRNVTSETFGDMKDTIVKRMRHQALYSTERLTILCSSDEYKELDLMLGLERLYQTYGTILGNLVSLDLRHRFLECQLDKDLKKYPSSRDCDKHFKILSRILYAKDSVIKSVSEDECCKIDDFRMSMGLWDQSEIQTAEDVMVNNRLLSNMDTAPISDHLASLMRKWMGTNVQIVGMDNVDVLLYLFHILCRRRALDTDIARRKDPKHVPECTTTWVIHHNSIDALGKMLEKTMTKITLCPFLSVIAEDKTVVPSQWFSEGGLVIMIDVGGNNNNVMDRLMVIRKIHALLACSGVDPTKAIRFFNFCPPKGQEGVDRKTWDDKMNSKFWQALDTVINFHQASQHSIPLFTLEPPDYSGVSGSIGRIYKSQTIASILEQSSKANSVNDNDNSNKQQ